MAHKTDIEIAREAKKLPIMQIGAKLGIPSDDLLPYGHDKAKVGQSFINSLQGRPDGKLILVTAINPTPAGEGKTTTTVGLGDGLNRIGKKAVVCIREASLGPELRHEGWGCGRRLCAGRADGGDEPALYRRFPRHHQRAQPAVGDDRQPYLLGQRAGYRRAPHRLAPGDGHERPRAARYRGEPGRRGQRLSRARPGSTSRSRPRSWRSCACRAIWKTCRNGWAISSWPTGGTRARSMRVTSRPMAR